MRLKKIAIVGLVIGLLLIALPVYAGMCKRGSGRAECRALKYPAMSRATVTPSPSPGGSGSYSETGVQNTPVCDYVCGQATMSARSATWQAANCAAGLWNNDVLSCVATVAPTWTQVPAYP